VPAATLVLSSVVVVVVVVVGFWVVGFWGGERRVGVGSGGVGGDSARSSVASPRALVSFSLCLASH
jgi:hypothetical protein